MSTASIFVKPGTLKPGEIDVENRVWARIQQCIGEPVQNRNNSMTLEALGIGKNPAEFLKLRTLLEECFGINLRDMPLTTEDAGKVTVLQIVNGVYRLLQQPKPAA